MAGARVSSTSRVVELIALGMLLLAACATRREHGDTGAAARPQPVTVPKLQVMLDQGESIAVIIGEMEQSGTVYRLTNVERDALRSQGMPASILSFMELTYDRAVRRNPDLAKSNERWIKVGDYWYGGLPAGWPREWVAGP